MEPDLDTDVRSISSTVVKPEMATRGQRQQTASSFSASTSRNILISGDFKYYRSSTKLDRFVQMLDFGQNILIGVARM
jgi:hypothetical protein